MYDGVRARKFSVVDSTEARIWISRVKCVFVGTEREESPNGCLYFIHWFIYEYYPAHHITPHTFLFQVRDENICSVTLITGFVLIYLHQEFRLSSNSSTSEPDDVISDSRIKSSFPLLSTSNWRSIPVIR